MVTTAAPVTYMSSLLRTLRALAAGGPLPALPTRTLPNGQVAVQVGRGQRADVGCRTQPQGSLRSCCLAVSCPHPMTLCASLLPAAQRHVARAAGVTLMSCHAESCIAATRHVASPDTPTHLHFVLLSYAHSRPAPCTPQVFPAKDDRVALLQPGAVGELVLLPGEGQGDKGVRRAELYGGPNGTLTHQGRVCVVLGAGNQVRGLQSAGVLGCGVRGWDTRVVCGVWV